LKIKGFSKSSLAEFRKFYLLYPQIIQTPSGLFKPSSISPTPLGKFNTAIVSSIYQTLSGESAANNELLFKISFSHFRELVRISDPLKRQFYEIEGMKGTWSVRELRRQISSLYFERSAMSKDKAALSDLANQQAAISKPTDVLKDFYVLEF